MTTTFPSRFAWPDENHDRDQDPPTSIAPPEYASVQGQLVTVGKAAIKEISKTIEASGHELAKLRQRREHRAAQQAKRVEAGTERQAVHARADAADRTITGAPHGNRRGRIPTVAYVLCLGVLFVLNIPLDMTGLFGLEMPLVYTMLLAAISGVFILGAGHLIGHYLKRRSQCVAPDVQLPRGERRMAMGLGITVGIGICVLAALRALTTGILGGVYVFAMLAGAFALAVILAYHHAHDGERDRRRADRQVNRQARVERISQRAEERQQQRFLRSRTDVAAVATAWVAQFDLLESMAVNNWRINHPDEQAAAPRLSAPTWVKDVRALAAGAVPTYLLLPEERSGQQHDIKEAR